METAILVENGIRRIITLDEYANLISGKEKKSWPELCCVVCDKSVHQKGLLVASEDFTPRFSHAKKEPSEEFCPLGSESKRFNALDRNEKSLSLEEAHLRRERFMEPATFLRSYLICRHLRGGQGQLTLKEFTRMIEVADSIGMWRHTWLPEWSIPLMLMLMANHETRNGQYQFYYRIKRIHRTQHAGWDPANVHLIACWLKGGTQITGGKKKSSFQLIIPLSESYVNGITKLTERDATTWTQEGRFARSIERYRAGLLNNQQLQDE